MPEHLTEKFRMNENLAALFKEFAWIVNNFDKQSLLHWFYEICYNHRKHEEITTTIINLFWMESAAWSQYLDGLSLAIGSGWSQGLDSVCVLWKPQLCKIHSTCRARHFNQVHCAILTKIKGSKLYLWSCQPYGNLTINRIKIKSIKVR